MRYGVITDIHANFEALQAVYDFAQKQNIDELFCVGDIVGGGASPKECIEFIADTQIISVAGNHDWAVCGKRSLDFFDAEGQEIILWTRAQLSEESIEFLQNLPLTFMTEHLILVHATLDSPDKFIEVEDEEDLFKTFRLMAEQVCFVGHTHEPGIMVSEYDSITYPGDFVVLEPHCKYLVNAGSVGQPRDGNPSAALVIYDTQTATISIKRVPYNIREAQRKIIEAGLPRSLSERLSAGK